MKFHSKKRGVGKRSAPSNMRRPARVALKVMPAAGFKTARVPSSIRVSPMRKVPCATDKGPFACVNHLKEAHVGLLPFLFGRASLKSVNQPPAFSPPAIRP